MIEQVQKQVLFEEAARKGIKSSQLLEIPDILKGMLGITDIGQQRYGFPLTALYSAKAGEPIDVSRMSNFFTGVARDIKVSDYSLTNLENQLLLFNLEMWSRMQLLKNRSQELAKKAAVEKVRTALGATWIFTESFNNTTYIDMQNTTAWIDASEGIAFIPNSGDEKTVPMQEITLLESSVPTKGDFVGSSPKFAVDGLDSTNWRCSFVVDDGSWASAKYSFKNNADITSITIDPVGFGIEVKIDATTPNGTEEIVKAIVYSKKTYPIGKKQVNGVTVKFRSATTVLPKVVGIREIIFFQSPSIRYSEVVSQRLKPNDPFTEIKLIPKGEFPAGTKVSSYFRTATANVWQELATDWTSIYPSDTTSLSVNFTEAVGGTSETTFNGLFAKALDRYSVPLTQNEGVMEIGLNMAEVVCFKKDWIEDGEFPKILSPQDFTMYPLKRTWSYAPIKSYTGQGSGTCLQFYGETTIKGDSTLIKGGDYVLFQRKLDSTDFPTNISSYNQLCLVPLVGDVSSGMMQFDYNYKVSFMLYCPKAFSYQDARYWFYQGYRQANRKFYKDIDKSFGTFAIYINDNLVVSESVGDTITTSNTINDTDPSVSIDYGNSFSLNFNDGWNKVEILMNVYNPNKYGPDNFDIANQPYLQLSIYPSLFDPLFNQNKETYISKILSSGTFNPTNEFDLLWNLPKDPTFWSWSDDRQYLLFNTNSLFKIDNYYRGSVPDSLITFKSISASGVDDLYIKLALEREDSTKLSPIVTEYSVMVR